MLHGFNSIIISNFVKCQNTVNIFMFIQAGYSSLYSHIYGLATAGERLSGSVLLLREGYGRKSKLVYGEGGRLPSPIREAFGR